jgi:tRNA(adenine34) deaminase
MNDDYFMRIANLEGEKALARGDYPAGCVIVKEDKIVAKASSRGITKRDATAHAEILAISKACNKLGSKTLDGCIVYSNIEPCLMCAKAMMYARIKKVVYGTEHKEYGNKKTFDILKQNGLAKYIEVASGLQKEKASRLLNTFLERNPDVFK